MVRQRICIRFSKQGDLRLIGHRDLMRVLERLFRRCGLRMRFSQGFHPKVRMSFPQALAVGVAGLDEVVELELAEHRDGGELLCLLSRHTVPGLTFKSVQVLPPEGKKAQAASLTYEIPLPAARQLAVATAAKNLLAEQSHEVTRDGKKGPFDIRPSIDWLDVQDAVLQMRLFVMPGGTARPREILQVLGLSGAETREFDLVRTTVELKS